MNKITGKIIFCMSKAKSQDSLNRLTLFVWRQNPFNIPNSKWLFCFCCYDCDNSSLSCKPRNLGQPVFLITKTFCDSCKRGKQFIASHYSAWDSGNLETESYSITWRRISTGLNCTLAVQLRHWAMVTRYRVAISNKTSSLITTIH